LRQHSSFNRNLHLQIICVLTGNLKVIRCSRHYQCGGARNTLYCTFFFKHCASRHWSACWMFISRLHLKWPFLILWQKSKL